MLEGGESVRKMNDTKGLKRQRVSIACQSCRSLKAKCDGTRPVCSRCSAYGYECVWTVRKRLSLPNETAFSSSEVSRLLNSIHANEPGVSLSSILVFMRNHVDGENQDKIDEILSVNSREIRTNTETGLSTPSSPSDKSATEETYLGEASDAGFLLTLGQETGSAICDRVKLSSIDCSYDDIQAVSDARNPLSMLPIPRNTAYRYANIFFSTIGNAYPFVPYATLETFIVAWCSSPLRSKSQSLMKALACAIFAIGACYEALSTQDGDESKQLSPDHSQLYGWSATLAATMETSKSLEAVWVRLAQCFHLLATTQIDRCWTLLGATVRVAQSIGLHTEMPTMTTALRQEKHKDQSRTTWYCVFILDHLLSLQLGRPPAVNVSFIHVKRPRIICDALDEQITGDCIAKFGLPTAETVHEYLSCMISFSYLIADVMQHLYSPRTSDTTERLAIIDDLDRKLIAWRSSLPRRLRFDLGHTFETCSIDKRQRNFLAIKFHHLRSLLYRPCFSHLKQTRTDSNNIISVESTPNVFNSMLTCIASAQSIARLLHNIQTKQEVVHDFPWWQMISCLICASSILLVAKMYRESLPGLDMLVIEEDAEVCLKVFRVLSVNSKAAMVALDTMNKLREASITTEAANYNQNHQVQYRNDPKSVPDAGRETTFNSSSFQSSGAQVEIRNVAGYEEANTDNPSLMTPTELTWNGPLYGEMSDPLLWSSQFLNDDLYAEASLDFGILSE